MTNQSAYAWEADEWRDALNADDSAACYRHHMRSDGRGGGVCRCGETLSPEEL